MRADEAAKVVVARAIQILDESASDLGSSESKSSIPIEDVHREWTYLCVFSVDCGLAVRFASDRARGREIRRACMDAWSDGLSGRVQVDEAEINARLTEYGTIVGSLGPNAPISIGKATASHLSGNSADIALRSALLFGAIQTATVESFQTGA